MIGQIIKKQLLLLWRNPMQLVLLAGLPIILIAILGTALSGMMEGGSPNINMKIGFINHGDEEKQIDQFIADMEEELPSETVESIRPAVEQWKPAAMLKDVFDNEELKEMTQFNEAQPAERDKILADDSYTAVIEIPENFTYETLENRILDKTNEPALNVSLNNGHQIGSSIVNDILHQFQEQLTLGEFLANEGIDQTVLQLDEGLVPGDKTSISQKNPVSAKDYYAVGMAVMNVLFIASTIGSIAFLERQIHVFDRVILANVSRWIYFIGTFISASIISALHLLIVYGFAWAVYGVSWPNLAAFFTVTLAFAIAVGGIAVLLTAISYRFNSEVIINFFSGIIVTLMAVLGGSFFPIGDSSPFIRMLGNLTPNGAGMSSYLKIIRGDGIVEISSHLLFLAVFALVAIIIAALSFPKRGASI
ncbi:hypothetical protein CIL03_14135 [Virgibacillus indicus]|uniref:ABC-2 type transporter transmembrane domain-containing protein n=1 Tax=Virgibacillus indicus TaxID=2024554 RepID=A0A265N7R5_9BACI|nr:ABC transporter permease [Virgibacillus indicus]OZU87841.1 hypothetical protein CIL03_14135 [Virgibacillus indicus]